LREVLLGEFVDTAIVATGGHPLPPLLIEALSTHAYTPSVMSALCVSV